jgi:hypothetical protein
MILPNGAKQVVDARKRGFKPAEMLIVSLIGPVDELNHTIFANPAGEYDWRWMVGLDACVFVRQGVDWRPVTMAIARAKPRWLGLYDVDRFQGADVWALPKVADIDKPQSQWRYQLEFMPWLSFQNKEFAWGK